MKKTTGKITYALVQLLGLIILVAIFIFLAKNNWKFTIQTYIDLFFGLSFFIYGGIGYRQKSTRCPFCDESIRRIAVICKHCGKEFSND